MEESKLLNDKVPDNSIYDDLISKDPSTRLNKINKTLENPNQIYNLGKERLSNRKNSAIMDNINRTL